MSDVLASVQKSAFVEFQHLFKVEEGRMGVTVTFVALLELLREGMIELVQAEAFGPLHVRAAGPQHGLRLVSDTEMQPTYVAPSSVAEE